MASFLYSSGRVGSSALLDAAEPKSVKRALSPHMSLTPRGVWLFFPGFFRIPYFLVWLGRLTSGWANEGDVGGRFSTSRLKMGADNSRLI